MNLNHFDLLSRSEIERAYAFAYDGLITLGVIKKKESGLAPVPTTLLPSPFPKNLYDDALEIQTSLNNLMHQVSQDSELLIRIHKPMLEEDSFVKHLFEIYKRVQYNSTEKIFLGLNRSDYMADRSEGQLGGAQLKQIEVNLMASSYGGIMGNVHKFHKSILGTLQLVDVKLPECQANERFAEALYCAAKTYTATYISETELTQSIAMIVSEYESNEYDQRNLEAEIYKISHGCRLFRITLEFLCNHPDKWYLTEDKRLFIQGVEIAVIYFRHGYSPDHFLDEKLWTVREKLETALAVKCPCISYLLANTKITQAALSNRTIFDKYYFTNLDNKELVWNTFGRQVALSVEFGLSSKTEIDQIIQEAIENPDKFVLKPQREGGSNNFFGDEMVKILKESPESKLKSFVLMEKFNPISVTNYPVKHRTKSRTCNGSKHCPTAEMPDPVQMIGELGIYGSFISVDGSIVINEGAGYLLRSKSVGENEGGITMGFSNLDSPSFS